VVGHVIKCNRWFLCREWFNKLFDFYGLKNLFYPLGIMNVFGNEVVELRPQGRALPQSLACLTTLHVGPGDALVNPPLGPNLPVNFTSSAFKHKHYLQCSFALG
jgi:hypothetical protein